MTNKSKTEIKAFFQTNDTPSEAQFIDLIDSYVDKSGPLGDLETNASAGGAGVGVFSGGQPNTGSISSYADVRSAMSITVYTTALVTSVISGSFTTTAAASAAAADAITAGYATTAAANSGAAASGIMNPVLVKNAIATLGTGGTVPNGGYASSRYYFGLGFAPSAGSSVQAANRLYGKVFVVGSQTTFTRIGLEVTAGAGTLARLGIYNFANGIPTSLVLDAGTVSTASTGKKEITISQALSPGIYVLAAVFNNTPDVIEFTQTASILNHFVGGADVTNAESYSFYGSHTFGALPSTFPSIAAYETTDRSGTWLRVV